MSDTGLEAWTEHTTKGERVRSVVATMAQPRSVEWISDQAGVPVGTAQQWLDILDEEGSINREDSGEYTLNEHMARAMERYELMDQRSKDELIEMRDALQDRVGDTDTESEESLLQYRLDLVQEAIELY